MMKTEWGLSQLSPLIRKQIEKAFPEAAPGEVNGVLADLAHELACAIAVLTPQGREQSLALTKLEETMHWTKAAGTLTR